MAKHSSRRGVIVGIVALVGALAGPIAPAQADALIAADVGGVSYSTPPTGNFAVGDSVSVTVCFVGTVTSSAAPSGLKLNMSNGMQLSTTGTLSNSPAGAGGTPPAGTNNCLVFTKTIATTDTSVLALQATGLFIPDGLTVTVGGANSTTGAGGNTVVDLGVKGALSNAIGVNAKPTVVAFTPANNVNTVKRDAAVALTFNEAIRLVATKVINLRKDVDSDGSFDSSDTVLEAFTIPTYVNAGTGVNTTNNEYHPTSNETRIEVAGSIACLTCTTLVLRPNLDMDAAATYYLEIPSDAIVDTTSGTALAYAGLNTSGTLTHKFTTVADGASAWTSGPSVYQVTSSKANGSYKAGEESFNIDVKFSSAVTLDGTAKLRLNVGTGGVETAACTLAGDGLSLSCPYTIASGHNSLNSSTFFQTASRNLNVASAAALAVTGGTGIKGTGSGTPAATLTLPTYGTYSLGNGNAIKVDTTAPVRMGSNPPVQEGFMQGPVTVARDSSYLMFFDPNETLSLGSNKNLVIKSFVGNTTLETINTSTDAAKVTISGSQVTINPTANLIGPNVAVTGATRTGNSVVYATGSTDHGFKAPVSITAAAVSSNVATITAASHGLIAGDRVFVAGLSASGANGLKTVTTAANANTFTYTTSEIVDGALTLSSATASHSVIVTNAGTNYSTSNPNHCIVSAVDVASATKTFTCDVVTPGSTNGSATFSPAASAGRQPETVYYITYEAGFLKDAAGNDLAALSVVPTSVNPPTTGSWMFRSGVDTFPPSAVQSSTIGSCGGTCVPVNAAIVVTFSEVVVEALGCTGCDVTISPAISGATLTVAVSGTSVTVTPSVSMAAGTAYTLTIDKDRITDGSGNKPAADVTVTFTTASPGSGGGGGGGGGGIVGPISTVPTNCGPPPLPPCNVGPGINFGPGGMIQNPGALRPEDMANLRPDNFMGFRPDDARNLGAGALQNFKPDQFGALPPTAMAGFNRDQINNLNPAAMAGMNRDQMRALPPEAMQGFRPDQMAQLPPEAMAGMDRNRLAALPPTAMQGFRPDQMRQLPPEAMAAFDPTKMAQLPPAAMAGFDPTKMAALPSAAVGGFNANQFAQLPPAAMAGFDPSKMLALPPAAVAGFSAAKMQALPPEAMRVFDPAKMAQLPPAAMAGFDPTKMQALPPQAMAVMNPNQLGQMPAQAMEAIRFTQMSVLPPNAMQGFRPELMAALPPQIVQAFKPEQFASVPPTAFGGMEPDQIRVLPPNAARVLSPQQVSAVPPQALAAIPPGVFRALPPSAIAALTPEQRSALPPQALNPPALAQPATAGNIGAIINSISGWNIDKVPPAAFTGMRPTDIARLPSDAFTALSPQQIGALSPQALAGVRPQQMSLLPPEAMAAMRPTQLGAMPPSAMSALSPAQVSALPPAALTQMRPTQAAQLPAEAFEAMKPTQVGALPPAAVGGLKPEQVSALPPEAMSGLKPAQVGALKPNAVAALEPEQVAALPPTALTQMKPTQAAALPVDAIAEMKSTQIAALPPAAVGGLKPEQVSALPPEAMSAMKPTQVAAMKPTAMAGLEPAQVDALPPTALRQVSGPQLGAIPPDAMRSLDTTQINALPTSAFRGMRPDQANALSPDQARAMSPQDVAQMPPAVRTIVNNLKTQPAGS